MMKRAFANGGLWFFGSIAFILFFGSQGDAFKEQSDMDILIALAILGVVAGGVAFFYSLLQYFSEERKLELRAREERIRQAAEKHDGTNNAS